MTIWRMRIARWIPEATNTHSQYVTLIAFPMQQCFRERASLLRYMYSDCIVVFVPYVCVSDTEIDTTDSI